MMYTGMVEKSAVPLRGRKGETQKDYKYLKCRRQMDGARIFQ